MSVNQFVMKYRLGLWQRAFERVLAASVLWAVAMAAYPGGSDFVFMEAVESKGAPKLDSYGLKHLHVVNPKKDLSFEGGDKKNMVRRESVERVARSVGQADMVCIDIESWPTCNTCRSRHRSLDRHLQVLNWFRKTNDFPKLGYWGRPPKHDYFRAIKSKTSNEYRDWQKHNDFYKPLGEKVDVLFPSLYARYDDVEGWVKHAITNLEEAKKYGKPVYAFITPYFVRSDEVYSKKPLDPGFWKRQLETVHDRADGLVIWTGPMKKWNHEDPWWKVTKEFLVSKGAMAQIHETKPAKESVKKPTKQRYPK